MTAIPDATRPLSGVRIVEISSFVAVPLAGMTLAQLGAEVIRVDPIGGAADYRRWPVTGQMHIGKNNIGVERCVPIFAQGVIARTLKEWAAVTPMR